jgi:hypothetical protein
MENNMDIEHISNFVGLTSSPEESGTPMLSSQFTLESKIEEIFSAMDLESLNADDLYLNDNPGSLNSNCD